MDRSSNMNGNRVSLLLISPDCMKFEHALRFKFSASNNEAKYEALFARLSLTMKIEA